MDFFRGMEVDRRGACRAGKVLAIEGLIFEGLDI
jgi:hypothetical protein